jgi:hypothetical protein
MDPTQQVPEHLREPLNRANASHDRAVVVHGLDSPEHRIARAHLREMRQLVRAVSDGRVLL